MTGAITDHWRPTHARRALCDPLEAFDIPHPALPEVLDGLTILHISDLHVRRHAPADEAYRSLLAALDSVEVDLVAITGDLTDQPRHEDAGVRTLRDLARVLHARLGTVGCFGNHDAPAFRRRVREEVFPALMHWPGEDETPWVDFTRTVPDSGATRGRLRVIALDWPEDVLRLGLALAAANDDQRRSKASKLRSRAGSASVSPSTPRHLDTSTPFPIVLAHYPTAIVAAAGLGLPLLLAGHTHAGQVRLWRDFAPYTCSDLPPGLAGGVLRLGATLCCITRGLGEGLAPGLRINCARQAGVYTLRRAELPRAARGGGEGGVMQVMAW